MGESIYQIFNIKIAELTALAEEYYEGIYPLIKNNNILIRTKCFGRKLEQNEFEFIIVENVRVEPTYSRLDYNGIYKNRIEKVFELNSHNTRINSGKGRSEGFWLMSNHYDDYSMLCTIQEFEYFNKIHKIKTGITKMNLFRYYNQNKH